MSVAPRTMGSLLAASTFISAGGSSRCVGTAGALSRDLVDLCARAMEFQLLNKPVVGRALPLSPTFSQAH